MTLSRTRGVILRHLAATVVISLLVSSPSRAQPRPKTGEDFPAAAFDSLDQIAFYLWQYDSFAWQTSDRLVSEMQTLGKATADRLGPDWFCFKRDSVWHAVYGKFDETTDRYDAVVHYVGSRRRIVRSPAAVDSDLADRFGRALSVTRQHLPKAFVGRLRFNSYVRERKDGGIDTWYIPSWQPNGLIVYGVEYQYTLDRTGRTIKDSVVRLGDIKGMRPDSTASLNLIHDEAPGIPTVAELLFVRLYTKYFAHVRVRTRDWVSEIFKGPQPAWVHALRQ